MAINDVWASLESLINTGSKAYASVKQADAASKTRASPTGRITPGATRNAIPGDFSEFPQNDASSANGFEAQFRRNQSSIAMALVAVLGLLLVLKFARR